MNEPFSIPLAGEIELWAGPECTHNRVDGRFFEQLDRTGHSKRIEDLELMADLGAKAVRYPVLWERTWPARGGRPDWEWSDMRLAKIRELGLSPIVGLLHHGSGPAFTNLLDPEFPSYLGEYAGHVARRYPWVTTYTPVNEPLTTARFSGLYGHWYPHGRNDRAFVRCLLNQCRGVVLAMRAIREVNPIANLLQTEDLGFVSSTPVLQYQADFENERRWLSLDLLRGSVTQSHPMWSYLRASGASELELARFQEEACPPQIIGFNHYLTSQRFLHEKTSLYPPVSHGSNGRHTYADLELVRVRADGMVKLEDLLAHAGDRFGIPMAITECHNGSTREEQLRWIGEVWQSCLAGRQAGVDVRAVTAWSVFGAMDWNTLATQNNNHYEPGLFDIRSPQPRATALADAWGQLGSKKGYKHALMEVPGWWHRPERLVYDVEVGNFGAVMVVPAARGAKITESYPNVRPVLITGAGGTLGNQLGLECEKRAIGYRLLDRGAMDIADAGSVADAISKFRPWAVINAAGYVRVDEAEQDPRCWRENVSGPTILAAACLEADARLVTFSSDLVFDGTQSSPYIETDPLAPLNEYGRSKAAAERSTLMISRNVLIVRTSAFFSPFDDFNFATAALRALANGQSFKAVGDCVISPTFVPDLATNTLDLLIDGESGIWHLANRGEITWYEFARLAAERAGISIRRLDMTTSAHAGWIARRPAYSALGSERGQIMPSIENALSRYIEQYTSRSLEAAA